MEYLSSEPGSDIILLNFSLTISEIKRMKTRDNTQLMFSLQIWEIHVFTSFVSTKVFTIP